MLFKQLLFSICNVFLFHIVYHKKHKADKIEGERYFCFETNLVHPFTIISLLLLLHYTFPPNGYLNGSSILKTIEPYKSSAYQSSELKSSATKHINVGEFSNVIFPQGVLLAIRITWLSPRKHHCHIQRYE